MKKIFNIYWLVFAVFTVLFASCKKEGEILVKPVKAYKPYIINGYVVGDPLLQFCDGEQVRELHGKVGAPGVVSRLVFYNDVMNMEFRSKSGGKTVYQQTFTTKEDTCKVPSFYYDGTMHSTYTYPQPQGSEYLANFYLDFPKDSAAADLVIEVIEFYYNWALPDPTVIIGTTSVPLATNVTPGKWTEYITVTALPDMVKHHPESEFWPTVYLKKAGTGAYYVMDNKDRSAINFQFPNVWDTRGITQSIHIIPVSNTGISANDLVQLFPR